MTTLAQAAEKAREWTPKNLGYLVDSRGYLVYSMDMTTNHHSAAGTPGGKEATMATTPKNSASRKLAALGHPGYGNTFAKNVLAKMESFGLTAHEAIYGGQEAARKIYAARGF